MTRGAFITLEGGEGAGKTTQVARLADRLRRRSGLEAVATREPGGTPGAEAIRDLLVAGAQDRWVPLSETLLLYAARVELWERVINPALDRGAWVVCDRFLDSTFAYQGAAAGLGLDRVEALHTAILPGVRPDLTLVLDLDPSMGLERAKSRAAADGKDISRYEGWSSERHARIAQTFRDMANRERNRVVLIDASQDLDTVTDAVWTNVEARWGDRLGQS